MTTRTARRLAWSLWGLGLALAAAQLIFRIITRSTPIESFGVRGFEGVAPLVFGTVGALIAARRPQNPIGWLLLSGGLLAGLSGFSSEYGTLSFVEFDRSLPLTGVLAWLQNWLWLPLIATTVFFPLLLFPAGRLLSRRWRWAAWIVAMGVGLFAAGISVDPGQLQSLPKGFENPLSVSESTAEALASGGSLLFLVGAALSVAAIAIRFRRSSGEEREQVKWVLFAGVFVLTSMVLNIVSGITSIATSQLDTEVALFTLASLAAVGVAMGVAILKYRLYDIDVVINKTVVFGILAVFITLVYVAIVVGIGAAIGTGDEPNVGLSILATALVAVAFQPLRDRARRFANRLVYGRRATPYEILSEFAERMAGAYATEDVLPRMARTLTEGTGAFHAGVWLRVGSELRPAASWPTEAVGQPAIALSGEELPEIPGTDRAYPVRHQGELLGVLAVAKPPGDPPTPAEDRLLTDLASQAGLVLRNVRLIEELRASRQRLVAAQDEERRRLERNIHDGAQQHLVALGVKLGLVKTIGSRDPAAALGMLDQLQREAQEALETLRELARGIYPPLLADHGLREALRAQLRKVSVQADLVAEGIGRYSEEAEAAVYFCCLEALQNVVKYARASSVVVQLVSQDGQLAFSVADDGVGFDPQATPRGMGLQNMADRMAALGGELEVSSEPGRGTSVAGRLPARARERVSS